MDTPSPRTMLKSTGVLLLLPGLALLLPGCRPKPIEVKPEPVVQSEQEAPRIQRALMNEELDGLRLKGWPNEDSRWRLHLAQPDMLTIDTGAVDHKQPPEEFDALRFDADWLIVRVGPVGVWYPNQTIYFLIATATNEIRAVGGYLYSDMGGGGWGTIYGSARSDSSMTAESGRVRCSYSITTNGEGGTPNFVGSFEVATDARSESLRRDLESFGVQFPALGDEASQK